LIPPLNLPAMMCLRICKGENMIDEQLISNALKNILDPELKRGLLELGMIRNIRVKGSVVSLTLALTTSRCPKKDSMAAEIRRALLDMPQVEDVRITMGALTEEELKRIFPKHPLSGLDRVRSVVAVASGKGGVGKTTIAVNTALALVAKGCKVGILDADVYGPSIPLMLGLRDAPEWENEMMLPAEKYGLRVMSFGMLAENGQAIVWRGPLVAKAINQLLGQVMWGELDYLVIDLPPGTGDPSITIAQSIPDAAVLMVTTPQEVALADVRRSIELFRKFKINIIGLVENMSFFCCGHSEEPIEIFGRGGGEKMSREFGLPLLEKVPIDLEIGKGGDSGAPLMVSAPDSRTGRMFHALADRIIEATNRDEVFPG